MRYLKELRSGGKAKKAQSLIAAVDMDGSWLGRHFDERMIDDLKALHRKYRIHIAG